MPDEDLLEALIGAYHREPDLIRLLAQVGIPDTDINFDRPIREVWLALYDRITETGRFRELVTAASLDSSVAAHHPIFESYLDGDRARAEIHPEPALRAIPFGRPLTGRPGTTAWGSWGVADGRPVLATGGTADLIRLWDPGTGRSVREWKSERGAQANWGTWGGTASHPILATGESDGVVRLWNPATGRGYGEPIGGQAAWYLWGAWAAIDGRPVLAARAQDGTVRLWEIVEEQPVPSSLPPYRSDAPSSVDQLTRDGDATAVARLITARSARPPLAVGLFGDWGEGKSHFLALLHHQVEVSAQPGNPLAHTDVRQVRFNAWHYAETDLWASLVTELYAQLAAPAEAEPEATEQRRQSRLTAELIAERRLPQRLAAAKDRRDQLRAALGEPAGLWDSLPEHQRQHLRVLVGDKPEQVYADAARTVAALAQTGRMIRIGTLPRATAIVLPLVLAALAVVWLLPPVGRWAAALPAIAAVLVVARTAGRMVTETRRRGTAMWQAAMRFGTLQRQRLTAAAEAADAEVEALRREMRDFSAAGQLAGLVADRDAGGDFRSRLSMMSRIRQDFAHMSRLLTQAAAEPADAAGDELPVIDRIVVYIDDLDRCPPRRVVEMLEAVHLLLAVDLFVVVVAVDPRWLLSAIAAHYRDVLARTAPPPDSRAEAVDPDDETLWQSTPTQYLEKIFQVVLTLPPLETGGYQRMLRSLVGTRDDQPVPVPEAAETPAAPRPSTPDDTTAGTADLPEPGTRLPAARIVERVDPFTLDPDEIRLLDLLGPPHLVTTPRQVKRLANSYGLLTALRQDQREADLAGPYRAGMVLLAALVAYPALGPGLFVHLHQRAAAAPAENWSDFVDGLRPHRREQLWTNRDGLRVTVVQAQQWQSLADALHQAGVAAAAHQLPLPEPLSAWSEWVVPVGRLSFPTGRVVSTLGRHRPLPTN